MVVSFPWWCQQLCSLGLYSCNNFSLLSNLAGNYSKYNLSLSLSLNFYFFYYHFRLSVTLLLLPFSAPSLSLISHFFYSSSLCQQKEIVVLHVLVCIFFFGDIDKFKLFIFQILYNLRKIPSAIIVWSHHQLWRYFISLLLIPNLLFFCLHRSNQINEIGKVCEFNFCFLFYFISFFRVEVESIKQKTKHQRVNMHSKNTAHP